MVTFAEQRRDEEPHVKAVKHAKKQLAEALRKQKEADGSAADARGNAARGMAVKQPENSHGENPADQKVMRW